MWTMTEYAIILSRRNILCEFVKLLSLEIPLHEKCEQEKKKKNGNDHFTTKATAIIIIDLSITLYLHTTDARISLE